MFQPTLTSSTASLGKIDYFLKHSINPINSKKRREDDSHMHSFFEIYVNVSGDVSFLHGNNVYRIKPYDIIFSHPGEFHHCIYHSDKVHDHFRLWFMPEKETLTEIAKFPTNGHIRLAESGKKRLASLLCRLEEGVESRLDETVCLISLISLISTEKVVENTEKSPKETRTGQILEYIDAHLADIRRTSEIANAFYMSVPTLNRIIREETSLSPKKILEAKRMTKAEGLLREGMSVTEVCYTVGFGDLSRFISSFKQRFGTTPNKYKAMSKKAK